jgi:hypothetical protein
MNSGYSNASYCSYSNKCYNGIVTNSSICNISSVVSDFMNCPKSATCNM